MKTKGLCRWWFTYSQVVETPAEADIEPNRVVLNWVQLPNNGYLEAESTDGIHFTGRWGLPGLEDFRGMELKQFRAGEDGYLYFGKWWNRNNGDEGLWMFEFPVDVSPAP